MLRFFFYYLKYQSILFKFQVNDGDRLPKRICLKCCSKLQTLCDFVDTARKAQDILFARSAALDKVAVPDQPTTEVVPKPKIKTEPFDIDYEAVITPMEVNVDPSMVIQNSESNLSPTDEPLAADVRFLQGVEGENVTIKLIRPAPKNRPIQPKPIVITPVIEDTSEVMIKKILNLKPFACTLCRRSFLTELALKGHIWIHLREGSKERSFKCPDTTCNLQFTQRIEFIKHLRDHRGKNTCSICGRM